ncbi:MAG TPA: NADH-quinone oxidoreductase subunit N, partial [Fibrella sp.]
MPLTDQLQNLIDSLSGVSAEGWLVATFCSLLIAELILIRSGSNQRARTWLTGFTLAGLLIAVGVASSEAYRGALF